MHRRVAEIVRSGWCTGLLAMQRLLCRLLPRSWFQTRQQSPLCYYALTRRILIFKEQNTASWMWPAHELKSCTLGIQICIRLGICSYLYAWEGYHKYLPRLIRGNSLKCAEYFVHGTAMVQLRTVKDQPQDIPKILRRLPFAVFGSSTFRPWADRWTIRCISCIIMGPLPPSFESVRWSAIKEANGAMTALPCQAWG